MRSTIAAVGVLLLLIGAFAIIEHGSRPERLWIGGLLVLIGFPLLIVARRQLGTSFSVGPQAKGLVTGGLYARIRHPMYLFLDMALLGGIVLLRQELLLLPLAAIIGVQVWQGRRESTVLERAYGDAYREYARRTWW